MSSIYEQGDYNRGIQRVKDIIANMEMWPKWDVLTHVVGEFVYTCDRSSCKPPHTCGMCSAIHDTLNKLVEHLRKIQDDPYPSD